MPDPRVEEPAKLQVFRYCPSDGRIHAVLGELDETLRRTDLIAYAADALQSETFVCHAVASDDDAVADELCFIPQGDHCDILSMRTRGWKRHHGDHRRSLVEILNTIAAAVACGKLRILDADETHAEADRGDVLRVIEIEGSGTLARARDAVQEALELAGLDAAACQRTTLCVSEALTNILIHGGGHGVMTLRRLPGRLRIVVVDEGPGLNFLNWIEPPSARGQASMGYGFKIILDNLDAVALHTGPDGTTLLLDRAID
jgi:anti-sigma regulatory factor (Ser/Thr protein kinase)